VYGSDDEVEERTSMHKVHLGRRMIRFAAVLVMLLSALGALAQTDCADGDGILEMAPPKNMTVQELIQKFTAEETKIKEARANYTYTQDVLVQTLNGKAVDGQFHQITQISYDEKGKRVENVTFSEHPTLRQIQVSEEDLNDVRVFMPWVLTTEDAPQYNLTYAGQQHVDDLDTYVFHVEPKKEEKNRRYFQGRVWVDNRDFQVVKLCGKSVPDVVPKKKHQPVDVRPTFVGYRQLVDGHWFPAYAKVDDTLHFEAQAVHIREIVKFTGYKRAKP
jgi:outer membrane lipoprotein-sorting protein